VGGLQDATMRLDVAANNVANASTDGFRPSRVTTAELPGGGVRSTVTQSDLEAVDLPTEIVSMLMARTMFTANARMLGSTLRTEQHALDLLA
jgi:flagellar hook protein FlgE